MQVTQHLVRGMSNDEKCSLREFMRSKCHDVEKEDDFDTGSVVVVSPDTSPTQCRTPEAPEVPGLAKSKRAPTCKHKWQTSLGSNQHGTQLRCKTCGEVLMKTLHREIRRERAKNANHEI